VEAKHEHGVKHGVDEARGADDEQRRAHVLERTERGLEDDHEQRRNDAKHPARRRAGSRSMTTFTLCHKHSSMPVAVQRA
jgi:hypothetical protein